MKFITGRDDRALRLLQPVARKQHLLIVLDQGMRHDILDAESMPHGVDQGLTVVTFGARKRHLIKGLRGIVIHDRSNLFKQAVSKLEKHLDAFRESCFFPDQSLHLFVQF